MDLEEVKAKVAELSADQQIHLVAFLVHLRHQRDAAMVETTTSRAEDQRAEWISLEQLREKWKD